MLLAAGLEREEGDQPLGELSSGGDRTVLSTLNDWLYRAALLAPTRTEALIHLFLTRGTNPMDSPAPGASATAALRRSSHLLSLCAKARVRSPMALLERWGEGMASLCRKQYYEGFVVGGQQGFERQEGEPGQG